MVRGFTIVLLSLVTVCGMGCAMCCGPDMYTYPTFGGRVQRQDPEYGRVGSIFSDPADGDVYYEDGVESTLVPPEASQRPTPAVVLEKPQTKSQPAPTQNNALRSRNMNDWR